jgi:hypothetical protein
MPGLFSDICHGLNEMHVETPCKEEDIKPSTEAGLDT